MEKPNIFAGTVPNAKSASLEPGRKGADVRRSQIPMASGLDPSEDARPMNQEGTDREEGIKEKEQKLKTSYPPQPEEGDDEIGPLPDRVLGTHRFTVVTKGLENPPKKASGSESSPSTVSVTSQSELSKVVYLC